MAPSDNMGLDTPRVIAGNFPQYKSHFDRLYVSDKEQLGALFLYLKRDTSTLKPIHGYSIW